MTAEDGVPGEPVLAFGDQVINDQDEERNLQYKCEERDAITLALELIERSYPEQAGITSRYLNQVNRGQKTMVNWTVVMQGDRCLRNEEETIGTVNKQIGYISAIETIGNLVKKAFFEKKIKTREMDRLSVLVELVVAVRKEALHRHQKDEMSVEEKKSYNGHKIALEAWNKFRDKLDVFEEEPITKWLVIVLMVIFLLVIGILGASKVLSMTVWIAITFCLLMIMLFAVYSPFW